MAMTSEIKLTVHLDENKVPERIDWEAEDGGARSSSKAVLLALWDEQERNTLRIDLWTKEMTVEEMKAFGKVLVVAPDNPLFSVVPTRIQSRSATRIPKIVSVKLRFSATLFCRIDRWDSSQGAAVGPKYAMNCVSTGRYPKPA